MQQFQNILIPEGLVEICNYWLKEGDQYGQEDEEGSEKQKMKI